MSLFEQAKALGRAGRPQDGVALIERAAEQGDPEGSLILAHWHLYGNDRPRNAAAAYRLLENAARKGSTPAARTQAYLTANGTGTEADRDKALQILQQIAGADA